MPYTAGVNELLKSMEPEVSNTNATSIGLATAIDEISFKVEVAFNVIS